MKKSELEMLTILLRNEYGLSDCEHWQITAATKEYDCWMLTVQPLKDEGAENDSNE